MIIGDRLRFLREGKNLSQGEIETRTGLLRSYISRVENGHTIPAVETLAKFAHALEIPMYQLFYEGDQPKPIFKTPAGNADALWGSEGRDADVLRKLTHDLAKMESPDRGLLLHIAKKMAVRKNGNGKPHKTKA